MKPAAFLFIQLLLGIGFSGVALAQNDPQMQENRSAPVWNVRIELQLVSLPVPLAIPLVKELLDEKKAAAAMARLEALMVAKKATLVDWSMIVTHDDSMVSSNSVTEVRYPARVQAPSIGFYLDQGFSEGKGNPTRLDLSKLGVVPVDIQTEEVGMTLSIAARVAANGRMIELQYNPKFVRLIENGDSTPKENPQSPPQPPQFEKTGTSTSLMVRTGQPTLVGAHRIANPPDSMQLEIVKAEATKME